MIICTGIEGGTIVLLPPLLDPLLRLAIQHSDCHLLITYKKRIVLRHNYFASNRADIRIKHIT